MEFNINTRWEFTESAWEKVKHLVDSVSIPSLHVGIFPDKGDFVSFPGLDQFTFIIISREFQYLDSENLNMFYVLDIASEDDGKKTLRLVYSMPARDE